MNQKTVLTTRDVRLHRAVVYGFAALSILFAHTITKIPSGAVFAPLRWLRHNGAAGVEIFVILSALGAYHALEHKYSVSGFYKRRFLRVVPCSFIVSVISYGLVSWIDLPEFIGAITFFPYWLGFDALWFVPFILTLYLVYPLIYRLQKKCPAALWGLFAATLAFSALCCYILTPNIGHWLMPVMRFPVFLLGCILAPWADRVETIPRWTAPVSLAGYLTLALACPNSKSDEFIRSIGYIFLAIFLIIAITWLARLFTRGRIRRFIYRCFAFCGGITLEIYLIYSRLLYFMQQIPAYKGGRIGNAKLEIVTIMLTIILSLLLNRFCAWAADLFARIPLPSDD